MRVLIDATPVSTRLKGAGRFVVNLVRELPTAAPDDEFVAVTWGEGAESLDAGESDARIHIAERVSETLWEARRLPSLASSLGVDAVLTLRELVGFGGPPTLLHLAEPPALRLGQRGAPFKQRSKNRLLALTMRGSLRRAAAVTVSSEATAEWVEGKTGERPTVIPPGIDPFFLEPDDKPWGGDPFFLHPATGDARDNTPLVLDAFSTSAARKHGVRLYLTGTSTGNRPLEGDVEARGLGQDVRLLGWVPDQRLRHLYAHAIALVHPTMFEGFAGFQPLEAMAQGTPVIAMRAYGVTEVLDEAAELLEQADAGELATAIDRLWSDANLRRHLGDQGRLFAQDRTWARSATAWVTQLRALSRSI